MSGDPTVTVTWWGHATTTIELGGLRILTDPVFVDRLAHLRRIGGPTPDATARSSDVTVISHLHRDHLHLPSLAMLDPDTTVLAPRGTRAVLATAGDARLARLAEQVREVAIGDYMQLAGVRVDVVRAHHDGRRAPGSRFRGQAVGYRFETETQTQTQTQTETETQTQTEAGAGGATRVWFAGDTGLFDELTEIGPVDVAIVPIGGWGPTLGPGHLDPVQAAEAVRRVQARYAVPVHYATFWPVGLRQAHPISFRRGFEQPGSRFIQAVAAYRGAAYQPQVELIAPGATATITVNHP
jgi:L-ascorbate metabolism protein UlaG (beta-lactamase superfamily)